MSGEPSLGHVSIPDVQGDLSVREVTSESGGASRVTPPGVGGPLDVQVATHDDKVRRELALILIWLLIGVVIAGFVIYVIFMIAKLDSAQLMPLVQLFFTSVLTLVSTVIGFYFGSEYKRGRATHHDRSPDADQGTGQ